MNDNEIKKEYLDYKDFIISNNQRILQINKDRIARGQPAMLKLNNILSYKEYKNLYKKSIKQINGVKKNDWKQRPRT